MTPKLTAVGKNLLLRALTGETIKFTKVKLGNGTEENDDSLTELSNPLLTIPITQITIGDDYVTLTAAFNNSTVEGGFRITEAGFFAEDPDDPENEILYAIGNEKESTADYVPSNKDRISEIQFDALIFIGDAKNVTADINSSLVYASKKEFDEHAESKENPHGVTAEQIGLGNVPNVCTNDQKPTYETPAELKVLESGETLSTAFGKIKLAIAKLISHLSDKKNPHGVTPEDIKAAKDSHKHSTSDIESGILSTVRGGTGLSSPAVGGLLKSNGSNAFALLQGVGALFAKESGKPVFGTLPLEQGGTGATTAANARANLGAFGIMRLLTSADDLDNITDNGVYYYYTGDIPQNAPYQNAAIVEVLGSASDTTAKIQRVTRYGSAGWMSERPLSSGTWLAWKEFAVLNNDGVLPVAKGGTGAANAADARTNLGVPPTSHASSATTYGAGNGTNYGHVKLSDATDSTSGATGGIAATPKAVKEAYDKAKQALGEDDESAWKRLPLAKGVVSGDYGREYPVYRKIGPEVSIEGTVAYTASASTVTLATLPTGYRPKSPVIYSQNNCYGKRIARIHVLTSGLLEVEWVCNISDGSTVTEKLDWLDISIKYCVD